MKKTLLFFFLSITLSCFSQIKFISSDKKDARALADSLILNAKDTYIYKNEGQKGKYSYVIDYANQEDVSDRIYINFHIRYIDANDDLEIDGIPEYQFESVSGRLLDLYPFWNKFIDQQYTPEELSNKKAYYIVRDNKIYLIHKASDKWYISVKDKM